MRTNVKRVWLAFFSFLLQLLGVALTLGACNGGTSGIDDRSSPTSATRQAEAVLARPLARGEDNGLEVARWSIAGDDVKIRRALARHAERDVNLGNTPESLERHGFRAVIVRDGDLPSLLAELGGTTTAIAIWHGQMPDWRDIASVQLDEHRVAMVDGRAERLGTTARGSGGAVLRCMARGWTLPLEDGAVFSLSVTPQIVSDQQDFSLVLNRDTLRGRVFDAASIHVEMPRATALVLVGTAPERDGADTDPEGSADENPRSRTGPPAEFPPSIGEILLTDLAASPKRRVMLVLRIRLPDTLFPSETVSQPNASPIEPTAPQRTIAPPF